MKKSLLLLAVLLYLTGCSGSRQALCTGDTENRPISSVAKAIEGKEGGVFLNASPSNPGASPSMLIRGINSINAGTEPLYVVDGMPYDGPIDMINPNDIESIKVLKDPAETSIYGIRGGNGVVVIKTKTGRTAKNRKK